MIAGRDPQLDGEGYARRLNRSTGRRRWVGKALFAMPFWVALIAAAAYGIAALL